MKIGVIKRVKRKKKFIFKILILLIFLFFVIFSFVAKNPIKQDIPNYDQLINNNLNDYNDKMNKNKNDIDKLLEDGQIEQIKIYDDLIQDDLYRTEKSNPFFK